MTAKLRDWARRRRQKRNEFLALQVLTLVRIPLAIAFVVMLHLVPHTFWPLTACLAVLCTAEFTDLMDGRLARKLGIVSEWGAMLDPFADSFSRLIIYWGFATTGLLLPIVPLVMALRDVAVAYSRILLTKHGKSVSANWSGKAKAVVQSFAAMLAVWGPVYWEWTGTWPKLLLSWLVVIVTAASVVQYAAGALHAARRDVSGESMLPPAP